MRHPELRSGQILEYATVQHLNYEFSNDGSIEDPLFPVGYHENGYKGDICELANIFKDVELGTWAIDSRTMDWLWDFLLNQRPNTILEFGSGSSTCLFCAWMKKHNPLGAIISIDQSKQESEKTTARLASHGFRNGCVIYMDVDKDGKFVIDTEEISRRLNGRKIDMLFVDGPAGPTGCRENTFKDSMLLFEPSGHWFLHDSYRTGELGIIKQWATIKGVMTDGILACGNGLGMGRWNFV